MKFYKLTALTPLLVGDGQRLSPIDYMVWRDQVNVLDQAKDLQATRARSEVGRLFNPVAPRG